MSAASVVGLLWILFAVTHMGLSSRAWRPRVVAALGAQGFLGVYSLLALLVFAALVWFYVGHRHQGTQWWTLSISGVGLWAIYAGQGVAWSLVVAGVMTPSPASLAARPNRSSCRSAPR